MKKIIVSLATLILLALLGVFGLKYLHNNPRERVKIEDGSTMTVEELSFYSGGEKLFGKLYYRQPGDGTGQGQTPVVIYFHEPLKTAWPESVIKSLVAKGLSGYACGFRGDAKDAVRIVKRIGRESFASPDMLFLVSDASCADEIVLAAAKLGQKIQGLILIEPALTGKAHEIDLRYGKEFLTIDSSRKGEAMSLIEDYLEERGALK